MTEAILEFAKLVRYETKNTGSAALKFPLNVFRSDGKSASEALARNFVRS